MPKTQFTSSVVLPPEGKLHELLKKTVLGRSDEVVGLILPENRLVILNNHSKRPQDTFEVSRSEIFEVISGESEENIRNTIFWHSHPGGGIGPSRTDMQQKMPIFHHLVVSIVNDDLVYTYY